MLWWAWRDPKRATSKNVQPNVIIMTGSRATAEYGLDGRQSSAAGALSLFPHARCRLQQAHARLGLRRHRWVE
ncbi:hypothetical protein RGR602_CH02223 [Rhizobium gallicum bv. gallicum R602sp]|uniref:Uncharacterized protein n=1 Tax=Rhizobium gallicum bv. gallicum R602sp TaxID=1041138 RepID=A0A0B4X337_9HYPH|nr:hypothetical protein RGR602_CH02223 [Rhizobium gallicum bv. gallicum R602sp]